MIIKTDTDTRDRMCWLLRREISKNAELGAKNWLGTSINREIWNIICRDTEDLICIHNLIKDNEVSLAFESACNLDTTVRDVIGKEVWNWMSNVWTDNQPDHPRYSKTKLLIVEEDDGLDPDGEWDHLKGLSAE